MFGTKEVTLLELQFVRTLRELDDCPVGSSDYVKALEAAIKLHKLCEESKPQPVSRDTLLIVGGNLLGILMIIKHEHVNVIMSRAMNLLLRPR